MNEWATGDYGKDKSLFIQVFDTSLDNCQLLIGVTRPYIVFYSSTYLSFFLMKNIFIYLLITAIFRLELTRQHKITIRPRIY